MAKGESFIGQGQELHRYSLAISIVPTCLRNQCAGDESACCAPFAAGSTAFAYRLLALCKKDTDDPTERRQIVDNLI